MKFSHIIAAIAVPLVLASCTITEKQFIEYRTVIVHRPDLKAKVMERCVTHLRNSSQEKRELIAAVLNTSVGALPQTFCRRVFQYYLSGRMTYQDYLNLSRGKPTARFIRIMQGK